MATVQRLKLPVGPLRRWLESADLGEATLRIVRGTDHAEMASVYAEMDVLVLPSRTHPRGRSSSVGVGGGALVRDAGGWV